jgi:hypothetical protein
MKKTIFAAIMIVTMFATSCGSNETNNVTTSTTDTTTTIADSAHVVKADSTVK